ncbi:MAG: hypothetical protein P1U85_03230 [Verrucomicrobiales bacterium]|jgi:hypothetical protein|nr:hypothetical protein [Verrucomicrobiales bacterium]
MTKTWLFLSLFAIAFAFVVPSAEAGRFSHCECGRGDYKPPRGVIKYYTVRIKTECEERKICLPCGRYEKYTVKVITYRDRYSNGVQRTWKCVVRDSRCYECNK